MKLTGTTRSDVALSWWPVARATADGRLAVIINGDRRQCMFTLPERRGFRWDPVVEAPTDAADMSRPVPGRAVMFMIERKAGQVRSEENSNGG